MATKNNNPRKTTSKGTSHAKKSSGPVKSSTPEIPGIVPVAVIGIGCLFPGSSTVQGFWKDILEGKDHIKEIPPSHWLIDDFYDPDPAKPDKTYGKTGAFLSPVEFDPMEHGIPPANIPTTDTSQLLALMVAKRVFEDAFGGKFKDMDRSRISVILGVAAGLELLGEMAGRLGRPVWLKALREEGVPEDEAQKICDRIVNHSTPWKESTFPGLLGNVVAGRISNKFNLGGTNCTNDAACASSFSALSQSLSELYLNQADIAITGGVDTNNDPFLFISFSKTPALSRKGDCCPFSEDADGMVLGEGIGMIALKRLADAERDGDKIYAIIKGIGSSSDGSGTSVYAPLAEGQAKALRRCYQMAGYGPDTVELVEAHGTGTFIGDEVEVQGLKKVFSETSRKDKQWCALGSIKSQIGHTKSTAAAASMIKAILAVQHKMLPPTIKVRKPDPKLKLEESPFYLNTRPRPWIKYHDYPRRASVSSFGFGGTNFHATIEEYNGPGKKAPRQRIVTDELVLFSEDSSTSLIKSLKETSVELDKEGVLPYLAWKTQQEFNSDAKCKLAIISDSGKDLEQKLSKAMEMIQKKPEEDFSLPNGLYYTGTKTKSGPVAFIFPGQGSQYIDMGSDLYLYFKEFQDVWNDVNNILKKQDLNLSEIVFPKPVFSDEESKNQLETLTQTQWAQPSICATSTGISCILKKLGINPSCTGGHSLGELTALYEAGVIGLDDVIRTTRKRGELMARSSSTPGAMTAVAEPAEKVETLLEKWKLNVIIANYNSPKQIVLSGPADEIAEVEKRLADEGMKTHRLNVSTAFHSSLMEGACVPFSNFLTNITFKKPAIPVYSNAEAGPYSGKPEEMKKLLTRQLNNSVRFVEEIEAMYESGVRIFIEAGPGNVLTNLVKKILADKPHIAINIDNKNKNGITSLWHALAELAVNGMSLNLPSLWDDFAQPEDPREKPKPKFSVMLQGCNYERLYPPRDGKLPPPNPPRQHQEHINQEIKNNAPQKIITSEQNEQNKARPSFQQNPGPGAFNRAPSAGNAANTNKNINKKPGRPVMKGNVDSWLMAFQEIQRQNAEAHAVFQKAISESHIAFLKTAETTNMALSAMMTGQQFSMPAEQAQPSAIQMPESLTQPQNFQQPAMQQTQYHQNRNIPAAPSVQPAQQPQQMAAQTQAELVHQQQQQTHAQAPPPAVDPQPAAPAVTQAPSSIPEGVDYKEMLLDVVSDKTGYPKEILTVDMGLEADLGIDSIKRVEILSAIKDQNPWLPEVDPGEMANIVTLGDVLGFIEKFTSELKPDSGQPPAPQSTQQPPAQESSSGDMAIPAGNIPDGIDFKEMLLDIVSEKTGYPKEILTVDMGLEADLGIDSIKRVEILSAVKDQNPWLPEVDPGEMANIVTLGDVLGFIEKFKDNIKKNSLETDNLTSPAPAAVKEGDEKKNDEFSYPQGMGRYVLRAVPAPHSGFAMDGFYPESNISVTDDETGVAEKLVKLLKGRGMNASVVKEIPEDSDVLIYLGGLKKISDQNSAIAINRDAFGAAKKIAGKFAQSGGVFITVQDTGGDFGISGDDGTGAWLGGLPGLVKTAAIEWPQATVKAIDLQRGDRTPIKLARALFDEFLTGGPEIEVGLRSDGTRLRLESVAAEVSNVSTRINSNSVIVASGGARGVTAATLIELAKTYKPAIILLGRTPLTDDPPCCANALTDSDIKKALLDDAKARGEMIKPAEMGALSKRILANREILGTLEELEKAGSRTKYVVVDVKDRENLAGHLEEIRKDFGPITGIIHGAGVLNDKFIADKTPEQFDPVFNTKVEGARALLNAVGKDPIDTVCFFSSVAARYGNMGQCDYAMANEILNKVADNEAKKRKGKCTVKSINWGPWDGGMVSPLLKNHFKQMGIPLIPLQLGARKLVEELSETNPDYTEIVIGPSPPKPSLINKTMNPELDFNVIVNSRDYPYIDSHRIKNTPVIPVVMVMEWFLRAASICFPHMTLKSCNELKVLRGIQLESFENDEKLRIRCNQNITTDGAALNMELYGQDGPPRYSAVIEMTTNEKGNGKAPESLQAGDMEAWTIRPSDIYKKYLFHGPDFHVINSLDKVSGNGAIATLKSTRDMKWPGKNWKSDAAALDGGLQLAILWGIHQNGKKSLPAKIGKYLNYSGELIKGPVRCELRGEIQNSDRTVSDLLFIDSSGKLIAEMCDVEMYMFMEK